MNTSTSPKGRGTKPSDMEQSLSHPKTSSENLCHDELLVIQYKKQGMSKVHFCKEWDYMVIHSRSPEFEACLCDVSQLP